MQVKMGLHGVCSKAKYERNVGKFSFFVFDKPGEDCNIS